MKRKAYDVFNTEQSVTPYGEGPVRELWDERKRALEKKGLLTENLKVGDKVVIDMDKPFRAEGDKYPVECEVKGIETFEYKYVAVLEADDGRRFLATRPVVASSLTQTLYDAEMRGKVFGAGDTIVAGGREYKVLDVNPHTYVLQTDFGETTSVQRPFVGPMGEAAPTFEEGKGARVPARSAELGSYVTPLTRVKDRYTYGQTPGGYWAVMEDDPAFGGPSLVETFDTQEAAKAAADEMNLRWSELQTEGPSGVRQKYGSSERTAAAVPEPKFEVVFLTDPGTRASPRDFADYLNSRMRAAIAMGGLQESMESRFETLATQYAMDQNLYVDFSYGGGVTTAVFWEKRLGQGFDWKKHMESPAPRRGADATRSAELGSVVPMCECGDPGCPVHKDKAGCLNEPSTVVRRIDMDEGTTTFNFCEGCAEDALASGVFAIEGSSHACAECARPLRSGSKVVDDGEHLFCSKRCAVGGAELRPRMPTGLHVLEPGDIVECANCGSVWEGGDEVLWDKTGRSFCDLPCSREYWDRVRSGLPPVQKSDENAPGPFARVREPGREFDPDISIRPEASKKGGRRGR